MSGELLIVFCLYRAVVVSLIVSMTAGASENTKLWTGNLCVKREESFFINEGRYWQFLTEDAIYKFGQKGMKYVYERYGKEHNVDVATLRGDNFQPREFWSQPFEKILHTLYPVIRKHRIFYIANFDTDSICFYPHEEPHYEFINEIPHQFPEIVEYYFEEDVWREINEWMEKQGLKGIEWKAYQESLHNHYGAKEPLKLHDPKARRLPLYEYFLPCLS